MRNTGALRAAVLCSTAFVLLASFSGTAAADPVVQSPADQLPRELVEAVQRDLKISPQEYLDRAARAQELSAYASDFRASRPADFAGAWIGPDGNAVVAVTSPAAAQAVAKDGYATAQSPVSADGLEKSLADLNSWIAGLPREISEQINGTAIDFIDNQIVIDLVNSPIGSALNLPTLLANIKVILSPGGNKPVDPTPMGGDTYVTTSGPIADAPATDISICSFGFNAVDPSGAAVNLTAGHCNPDKATGSGGAPVYLPDPADISRSTQIGSFDRSSLGAADGLDWSVIALNDTGIASGLDRPTVRGANGSTVTVTGTAAPVIGAPVCKSGQSSSFTCGVVAADRVETQLYMEDGTSRTVRGFASTACTLAGDSGGAIVTGTLALGITSGSNSGGAPDCNEANLALAQYGGTASLGIPIDQVTRATGATLRTD
ncbi:MULTISPECIES: S1 family peptidase [unclassified Rhodococcus (in: high G+C Gram-positive bacteria)]|uniref:S1 family peptidase n=1 Tax=unclassified Rhodococcus (in: high G+C Gram-positive bacteria) TaxID=192944 RepID=UPI0015C64275|nr:MULTISPECIES: S1 family peptidase [unclassified Rhodococcus (in: high G+C Gram-positive bacteria)]